MPRYRARITRFNGNSIGRHEETIFEAPDDAAAYGAAKRVANEQRVQVDLLSITDPGAGGARLLRALPESWK